MVVEAKAGLFQTVVTQRSLKPVFSGQRVWTPLTESRLLSVASNNGDTRVEAVAPKEGEESILYERTRLSHGTVTMEAQIVATGDEINKPDQPWNGRIRRVDP